MCLGGYKTSEYICGVDIEKLYWICTFWTGSYIVYFDGRSVPVHQFTTQYLINIIVSLKIVETKLFHTNSNFTIIYTDIVVLVKTLLYHFESLKTLNLWSMMISHSNVSQKWLVLIWLFWRFYDTLS